ncbi:MAG: EamA family transporter [Rhodospirillaceae bacterium]|jgi:drug/metabolite transporter (DMT)-like permease|nr:EamA family transporter [Rhodospirillaceae bacterium]MBT3779864.1 EamA family transporter [Rhodospirillaceae bacterium]MBT3977092.1 EamA family transporter [Rhodospirillaceae bacterium]MBT4171286.1 EamA family transporter [Rhodospirillaceae bacterium]MBT4563767.1 EamA family transporter [Rhodospirillaceae bacterium]
MRKSNAPVSPQVGYTLLVTTWLCWGFSYPATAFVLESMDVWSSRVVVMTAAAAVLLVLGRMQGASLAVPRSHWRDLIIAAICNMAIFQICMTYGVQLLSAGRTSVIIYTMPLWAGIFAHFLLGERLTRARFLAMALGLVGLVVLIWQDLSHLRNAPLGAGLTLFAAVFFGLGVVWMKRRLWQNDPTILAGWQLLIGAVPVTLIWSLGDATLSLSSISRESWLAIAYLIIIANALAYFSWFRVIAAFPATVTGIGAMAVPIVGVMASAWLLDEKLGWREWLALALIISALATNLASTLRRAPA